MNTGISDTTVAFRVTKDIKTALKVLAAKNEKNLSDYILNTLFMHTPLNRELAALEASKPVATPLPRYEAVVARDVVDNPVKYSDVDLYYKEGDAYCKVDYLDWHHAGTTWVGGTLDVGFEDRSIDDIQIDPYAHLYVIEPTSVQQETYDNGNSLASQSDQRAMVGTGLGHATASINSNDAGPVVIPAAVIGSSQEQLSSAS
jgi:hypothetical protein